MRPFKICYNSSGLACCNRRAQLPSVSSGATKCSLHHRRYGHKVQMHSHHVSTVFCRGAKPNRHHGAINGFNGVLAKNKGPHHRQFLHGNDHYALKSVLSMYRHPYPGYIDGGKRYFASNSSFSSTSLGAKGSDLLDGLSVYTVQSEHDGHPLAVYGIESSSRDQKKVDSSSMKPPLPILLLHGRTWSSIPVYHLLGGPKHQEKGKESLSLMDALWDKGLIPYAMDFRGFGGTPHDETGHVEPNRCIQDTETVLKWIAKRHSAGAASTNSVHNHDASGKQDSTSPSCWSNEDAPALLGWSQGALVAQLAAQRHIPLMSKLILYGTIFDPAIRYPRDPLFTMRNNINTSEESKSSPRGPNVIENQYDDAVEDFTLEGTISAETAKLFAEAALMSDPHKAQWKHLYQFNNCDPARVHVPTMVVAGDQDPYAPLQVQSQLFSNLGRHYDRTFCVIADSDHAVHLLEGRERLINNVVSFVQNGKKSEQCHY